MKIPGLSDTGQETCLSEAALIIERPRFLNGRWISASGAISFFLAGRMYASEAATKSYEHMTGSAEMYTLGRVNHGTKKMGTFPRPRHIKAKRRHVNENKLWAFVGCRVCRYGLATFYDHI